MSVDGVSPTFLLNLDWFLAISSFWSGLRFESWKDSLQTFSMSYLDVLSGWSGLCHWFCVLLWGLPKVAYQEAVAMSLVECCNFFSINFGYISDPLHDAKISSICLFRVEEWSTGAVCGAHLGLAVKPPEHHLDIVLVPLLVALDNCHTLFWCSVADFEQVLA